MANVDSVNSSAPVEDSWLSAGICAGTDAAFEVDDAEDGEEANVPRIEVTPEENAAINRLCELGFDRSLVIQVYFACDKNEEMAANLLFSDHAD